jgi:hypothetical protein
LLPCCFVSKEDHRIMEQQQTAIGVGGGTNGGGGGGREGKTIPVRICLKNNWD